MYIWIITCSRTLSSFLFIVLFIFASFVIRFTFEHFNHYILEKKLQ